MERGTVSMRVAFVPRSAEVQPLFRRFVRGSDESKYSSLPCLFTTHPTSKSTMVQPSMEASINPHTPSDDDARQRVWTGYGAPLYGAAMARPDAIPRIENMSGWRLNTSCNVVHVYITRPLCDSVKNSRRRRRERQPSLSM